MSKYVFVTGGVTSSLGKGITEFKRNLTDAAQVYRKALELDSDNPVIQAQLAALHLRDQLFQFIERLLELRDRRHVRCGRVGFGGFRHAGNLAQRPGRINRPT